jgi:hypothetical protein
MSAGGSAYIAVAAAIALFNSLPSVATFCH